MIPPVSRIDSTRRLAVEMPDQPTDPYWGLIRVNVIGTLLTLIPLLPFYALVLSLTARQATWLSLAVVIAVIQVVIQDLWMIARHVRPMREALEHGGRDRWQAALVAVLNYPLTSIKRTYGPHVWAPMLLFSVLAVAFNVALGLELQAWKLAVVFPVSVTVLPLIHAVYEYWGSQRALLPMRHYAEAMLGGSPDPGSGLKHVGLAKKLFVPFVTTVGAPLVIVSVAGAIQSDVAVEQAAERVAVDVAAGGGETAWVGTRTADGRLQGPPGGPPSALVSEVLRTGTQGEGWIIRIQPHPGGNSVVAIPVAPLHGHSRPVIWWMIGTGAIWIVISVALMAVFVQEVRERTRALKRALDRVGEGDLEHPPRVPAGDEFGELAEGIRGMMTGLKEREQLQDLFGRHTSPEVVELLMNQQSLLGGTRAEATILFSDIRGFTKMSERMEPEEVVDVLNRYLDVMVKAIHDHKGRVDKFIGDGILAVFGYPIEDPDHITNAVRSTLDMRAGLAKLNEQFRFEGKRELAFGAGIHTGPVICGSIGSHDRLEFTVIGDVVNTASRVEGLTKKLDCDVVVTGKVKAATDQQFEYEHRAPEEVKGKTMALQVFVLKGTKGAETAESEAEAASQD